MSKNRKYESILEENLRATTNVGKVLSFTEDKEDKENMINMENINTNAPELKLKKTRSNIKNQPYKILEAPYIRDDFYLNLVDWNDNGQVGAALQGSLLIWSGCMSRRTKIYECPNPNDYLCSVAFMKQTNKVGVGLTDGSVKIFDLHKTGKSLHF